MRVLQQDTRRSYVAVRKKKKKRSNKQARKIKEAKTRAANSEKVIQ